MTRLDPGSRDSPAHQAFMRAADAFEREVESLRGPAVGRGPARREAAQYIRGLLAQCAAVSGQVTKPEIDLIQQYHLEVTSDFEELEDVRAGVASTPEFFDSVPPLLAVVHATPGGAVPAGRLVGLIRRMCEAAVAADRTVVPVEADAVTRYVALLEQFVGPGPSGSPELPSAPL